MAGLSQSVHAYWDPWRDPKICAEQLAAGLPGLGLVDERFKLQLAVGPRPDARLTYQHPSAEQIVSDGWIAAPNIANKGVVTLGLWNGVEGADGTGLTFVSGGAGPNVALPGQCLIGLPADPDTKAVDLARRVIAWAVLAFDPAWAIWADTELRDALEWKSSRPEVGPLTYIRGPWPNAAPPGTSITPLGERGYLLALQGWTPDAPWEQFRAVALAAQEQLRESGHLPASAW